MKNIKISAIIVAKNEEQNIEGCIDSVSWVDEILVFDNNSRDHTAKLASERGAIVHKTKDDNFSNRKNEAFVKAKGEWLFFLDADERCSPTLKNEIKSLIVSTNIFSGYAVPRKNIILGKELQHGWWPDYAVRLFLKDNFRGFKGDLHEQPIFSGQLGYLKSYLIHNKHDNLTDMVKKTNEWSEIEAKLMLEAKHPKMNVLRFLTGMYREFSQRFFVEKAFMDGTIGVLYGIYQIYSRFLSYAKLWEMQIIKSETISKPKI